MATKVFPNQVADLARPRFLNEPHDVVVICLTNETLRTSFGEGRWGARWVWVINCSRINSKRSAHTLERRARRPETPPKARFTSAWPQEGNRHSNHGLICVRRVTKLDQVIIANYLNNFAAIKLFVKRIDIILYPVDKGGSFRVMPKSS
ncbi:hypothetical protein D3C85_1421470 [compost metagenome]